MEKVKVLYRVKRYGKWVEDSFEVSPELSKEEKFEVLKESITKKENKEPTEIRTL